jgi:integrase/recombinase XerD
LSSKESHGESWRTRLEEHLSKGRYSPRTARSRIAVASRFLGYLNERHVEVEAVEPSHVDSYLREELRLYRQLHRRAPRSENQWRHRQTAGIDRLLRLLRQQWPPPMVGTSTEEFHQQVCRQYAEWMFELRGLALETRTRRCTEARQFLRWLGERGNQKALLDITIRDVDPYLMLRAGSRRRTTVKLRATCLRSFLRFLHIIGRVILDLSSVVVGPTLYALESIPSALRPDEVSIVLETTRKDRSRNGLRDYAILMLLSSYGLRAGEATALRLSDVDWQRDVLRIQHWKTGAYAELPLTPAVGNAILNYLRNGRPKTDAREIFIRNRAALSTLPERLQSVSSRA